MKKSRTSRGRDSLVSGEAADEAAAGKQDFPIFLRDKFSFYSGKGADSFFSAPDPLSRTGMQGSAFTAFFFACRMISGLYSKCMMSKRCPLPPQMKPLSSKAFTMTDG